MKTSTTVLVSLALALTVILAPGCSDLKDSLPPASVPGGVHPSGWLTKTSGEFHGKAIMNQGWDMSSCKTCHGATYDGGQVNVSCLTCHTGAAGPENCSTCHGSTSSPAPPEDLSSNTSNTARGVGAHQVHLLGTSRSKAATCAECHNVPGSVSTTGHIDGDNRAEVLMNNYLANLSTGNGSVTPNPAYNSSTQACSNTYCHGTFKDGNSSNAPVWNVPTSAACGSCHGDQNRAGADTVKARPTLTHGVGTRCSGCHGGVISNSGTITNASKHIDGKLNYMGQDISF